MTVETFANFDSHARAQGFDEVLVREGRLAVAASPATS
jgi:hypothetical protein